MKNLALRCLVGVSVLLVSPPFLRAELPPQYYREMQQRAPELLRIRTTSVSRDWLFWRSERKISVRAQVTGVTRSASGVNTGNSIYFEYVVFTPARGGWAGPRPMPLLTEGVECDFFGERVTVAKDKGIVLTPTARGFSFEALPD